LSLVFAFGIHPITEFENSLASPILLNGQTNITKHNIFEMMRLFNVKGVSVSIIHKNQIAWSKAYGNANVNSLFQSGSISKPVSATVAMKLYQNGLYSLDENVNNKLRRWKVPPHNFRTNVTMKRLLSHTAGTTVHGFGGYTRNTP
jgi:CubicO group peptidase (beta-lactamase class C family)